MSEDNTPEAVPSDAATSEEGEGNVSQDVGIAKALSEITGRDFKDDDTALKAVKDTFGYVGGMGKYKGTIGDLEAKLGVSGEEAVLSRMEELAKSVPADNTSDDVRQQVQELQKQVEEANFYAENPALKAHSALLTELRGSTGKSLSEVASSEAFKSVVEKAIAYDEVQKSKSVLESNPRLGQVRDKMKEARQAAESGNVSAARQGAVGAVLDAFDMK